MFIARPDAQRLSFHDADIALTTIAIFLLTIILAGDTYQSHAVILVCFHFLQDYYLNHCIYSNHDCMDTKDFKYKHKSCGTCTAALQNQT